VSAGQAGALARDGNLLVPNPMDSQVTASTDTIFFSMDRAGKDEASPNAIEKILRTSVQKSPRGCAPRRPSHRRAKARSKVLLFKSRSLRGVAKCSD
jgi:hypothetical protein